MVQQAFFFDGTRCTGCKTCVFACKDKNDLGIGVSFRKVYECVGGETSRDEAGCFSTSCFCYYLSISCNHCLDPVCVKVCPTEAMHKDPGTGLVSVNTDRCVGCGYCHLSCPYNAPKVDRDKGSSVKCDGCADLIAEGKLPVCVAACPSRALRFGPMEDMATLGERAAITPLPDPAATEPSLFVRASRDARPYGPGGVEVMNAAEVE